MASLRAEGEAIQVCRHMDCFVAPLLAMTGMKPRNPRLKIRRVALRGAAADSRLKGL